MPRAFAWLVVLMPACFILIGWCVSACILLAGRKLQRRTSHTFCFLVACVECLFIPFGTILGVFSIIVLNRPPVKELFASNNAAKQTQHMSDAIQRDLRFRRLCRPHGRFGLVLRCLPMTLSPSEIESLSIVPAPSSQSRHCDRPQVPCG